MQVSRSETDVRTETEHDQILTVMGNFASTLAHEINNQLTVVSGYCHLLLAQMPPSDARRDAVRAISEANQRLTQWTRRLQAMNGRPGDHQHEIDLSHWLDDWVAQRCKSGGDVTIVRMATSEGPWLIQADGARLNQWMDDLVLFVGRASDPSPPLRLELSRKEVSVGDVYGELTEAIVLDVVIPVAVWPRTERWDPLHLVATNHDSHRKLELGLLLLEGASRQFGARLACQSHDRGETSFRLIWPLASGPELTAH